MPIIEDYGYVTGFTLIDGGEGFAPGDFLRGGHFRVDTVSTSTAITAFDNALSTVTVSGDVTATYTNDSVIRIYGSTSNDRAAYVVTSVFDAGSTTITLGDSVTDEAPAGFITRGIVSAMSLCWLIETGQVGQTGGASYISTSNFGFLVRSVTGNTVTFEPSGDSRPVFDGLTEVFIGTEGPPPSGIYTIDSLSYSNGAVSITTVEDIDPPFPTNDFGFSYPVSCIPQFATNPISGFPSPVQYTVDEIEPGDGALTIIIDYIVVDV